MNKKLTNLPENDRSLFVRLVTYYVHSDVFGDNFEVDEINLEEMEELVKVMRDDPELEEEFKRLMTNYKEYLQNDDAKFDGMELFDLC